MPTVRSLYNKMLALYDSFTDEGVEIAPEDNIDLEKKFIVFADMAQKDLWKQNKATATHEIVTKHIENLIEEDAFNIVDFEGQDQTYPEENGVFAPYAYSIEVDGDCTIVIEELIGPTWTTLETINPTGITRMTNYKGVLTPSSETNPVRMRVSGTTHFRHMNRALYPLKYAASKVPAYAPWIKEQLPSNFNGVDAVIEQYPVNVYSKQNAYKLENYRDFYYAYNFTGRIEIVYKPIPVEITSLDQNVEIDDILAEAIVYDVAGKIGFYENVDVINYAEQRRLEAKTEAEADTPKAPDILVDYYGGGNNGYY